MPITINDCVWCGKPPTFNAKATTCSYDTCEFTSYEFHCVRCNSTEEDCVFDYAISRWNAANPRKRYAEIINECKCGNGRPRIELWEYATDWRFGISCPDCYQTFEAEYDDDLEELIAKWNEANSSYSKNSNN